MWTNLSTFNERIRKFRHLTSKTSGVADDDCAGWDVTNHDGAGADERVFSNPHSRQKRRIGADLGALADDRTRKPVLDARRERILGIREHHVGSNPAPVFEHRELGNEYLGVNP